VKVINPTDLIVLNNPVLAIEIFSQFSAILKQAEQFAPYQKELAAFFY
jgi:hypothetical protein